MKLQTRLAVTSAVVGVALIVGFLAGGRRDWKTPLVDALAGADRIVIEPVFPAPGPPTRWELRGRDKVEAFLALLEFDAKLSGFHCRCDGDTLLHFRQGERTVALLGHHHGIGLRWHNGRWPGDAYLTENAQAALPEFFQSNGIARFAELRAAELARRRRQADLDAAFAGFFPGHVREFILQGRGGSPWDLDRREAEAGDRIARGMDDPVALAAACSRALGIVRETWSTSTERERRVIAAMRSVNGTAFAAALERLGDDRSALLGAARLFFTEGFGDKLGAERGGWAARLAEIVFTDGLDDDKPRTLRELAAAPAPPVQTLLHEVASGRAGKEIDRKTAFGQEPGLRAGAALALAELGDARVEPLLRRIAAQSKDAPDVAAAEIGLALLGEPAFLRPEHLRLESYSIGFAALKAIERFDGRHGLDVLIDAAFEHPWAAVANQAVRAAERITGERFIRDDGAQERYSAEVVRDWRLRHGADFVRSRRALLTGAVP